MFDYILFEHTVDRKTNSVYVVAKLDIWLNLSFLAKLEHV